MLAPPPERRPRGALSGVLTVTLVYLFFFQPELRSALFELLGDAVSILFFGPMLVASAGLLG
eukprot:1351684-Prymnesium_polylepis.1